MLLLGAFNLDVILSPLKIAAGGINGLSILVENIFKINPSFFILVFQFILFILSYLYLGKEKSKSALYATIVYPLYVYILKDLSKYIIISKEDIIVSSIFGGIVTGIVSGYICKLEKSPGGVVLLAQIFYKKFNISISLSNFLINLFILILTFFFFGFNRFLYSLLLIYSNKKIMEKIIIC